EKATVAVFRTLTQARKHRSPLARFDFSAGERTLEILADQDLALLIGYNLLDQLPAMLRITEEVLDDGGVSGMNPPAIPDIAIPPPPREMVFYTLEFKN